MMNAVQLMGRLGADPELKHTPNGVAVASFQIACERDVADKDGKRQADWINIIAWRASAEFICKWFHKGDMMGLTGRLATRNYDDKDGNKRYITEVVVEHAYFGGATKQKDSAEPEPEASAPNEATAYSTNNPANFEEVAADDDLPF